MDELIYYDFNITQITIACFCSGRIGSEHHNNRQNHGLAINMDGVKKYTFDSGKTLILNKHEIVYLPKNSTYIVNILSPGSCYAINFDISEDFSCSPCIFKTKNTGEFKKSFKSAEQAWTQKHLGYETKCKSELYNILYKIKHEYNLGYISNNKLGRIIPGIDYIHKNYTSKLLNISELAEMCNITPEYFRDIFRKRFGQSPIKYINNLKITRAKELLSSNMYSVKEVAELSGYSDASHFSREFKKTTGISPIVFKTQS